MNGDGTSDTCITDSILAEMSKKENLRMAARTPLHHHRKPELFPRTTAPPPNTMDPRLSQVLVNWFVTLMMVADRRGQEVAGMFVQYVLLPETALFLDTDAPPNTATKRKASEIEPSWLERPTKRRRLERRLLLAYSRSIWRLNKELMALKMPFGTIMEHCKRISKGFQEIMRWEEGLFQNVLPPRANFTSKPNRPPRKKFRAA